MYKLLHYQMNVTDARIIHEAHFTAVEKDEKILSRVVEQVGAEMAINDRLEIK